MSAIVKDSTQTHNTESEIALILQHRYGDGMVYLPRHKSKALFALAIQRGYIDKDGYVTRKGRTLIASYKYL
jgi:hypothetical protein